MCKAFAVISLVASFSVLGLAQAPPPIVPPGYMIIEEDLMVPVDWYEAESTHAGTSWPGGIVPFRFQTSGSNAVSAGNQTAMLAAMAEWEAVADVDFVPWSGQADHVLIVDANSNSSALGKTGGQQVINIFNWNIRHVMVHELGHCLGLHHEQSRPDRDSFVTINFENINVENWLQFLVDPFASTFGTYDFDSVMHYGQFAFSNNGQTTIDCNPGFTQFQNTMGQRQHLSILDAQGMADRYGSPPAPSISSISPATVTAGGLSFVLTVNGSHFFGGSQDGGGVQGTQVWVNATTQLATTFVSPTRVTAVVPLNLIANPGTLSIDVYNPLPGGGPSNAVNLDAVCGGSSIALANGTTATISSPCQDFTIIPAASEWNVVGVASPSNWNVMVGGVLSNASGDDTDYVLINGHNGAISPANGNFLRASGSSPGTVLHDNAINLTPGTIINSILPANVPFRAYEFNITTAGDYTLSVTGDSSMFWRFYSSGTTAVWRPKGMSAFVDNVGDPPRTRTLSTGWHCIVIYTEGGVAPALREFTLSVCTSVPLVAISPNGITITNPCQPFSVTPQAGSWNCVGALSAGNDWNIAIEEAESEFTTGLTDFLVANGHLGTISDTRGMLNRVSGTGNTIAQAAGATVLPVGTTLSNLAWAPFQVLRLFEFEITTPGSYDLTATGTTLLAWRLYEPGTSTNWRPRSAHIEAGTFGTTETMSLGAGWHALMVVKDSGTGSLPGFSLRVEPTPNPVPSLTGTTPLLVNAGIQSFTLTCAGSNFIPSSVVRWGGSALATTFVSPTSLQASVPANFVASGAVIPITVFNPAPGGGTSSAVNFTVMNQPPGMGQITPSSAIVGSPAFALTVTGSGFNPSSIVRWNGSNLPTVFNSGAGSLSATVAANLIASAGTATVTVFNAAPGGGTSPSRTFTINNPAPVVTALTPSSVIAGSISNLTMTITGTGFIATSQARLGVTNLPATLVSPTQLSAVITGALLQTAGSAAISVFNPTPGGGVSAAALFSVLGPFLTAVSPASIPVMNLTSPSVLLTVSGNNFAPASVIHANGEALATGFQSTNQLTCLIGPSVLQTQRPGAICITVANTPGAISNSKPLIVGSGNNQGLIRRQPLDPVPGQAYAAMVEDALPNALFSLYVDGENPLPVTGFPNASANLVLAIGPFAGSSSLFPLIEGIGIYGPPSGATFDAQGRFTLPGFVGPNPPLGIQLTVQGIYLDPSAPFGFKLTWARWPDEI